MDPKFEVATLQVSVSSTEVLAPDLGLLVGALNGLVAASIWGALADRQSDDHRLYRAREILHNTRRTPKGRARFYPDFWTADDLPFLEDYDEFDPVDPLDSSVRDGLNSWLSRSLYLQDPRLYNDLFSFAKVQRLEHHSPLLVELAVLIAAPVVPALLAYGLMRTVAGIRRALAEARIREAEAAIREEELNHRRIQSRILDDVATAVHEMDAKEIPKSVVAAAAKVGTTSIADLGSSPLIGSVTLGVSTRPS